MRAATAEFKDAPVGSDARLRMQHHTIDVSAGTIFQGVIDAARAVPDQLDEQFAAVVEADGLLPFAKYLRQCLAFQRRIMPCPSDSDARQGFGCVGWIVRRVIGFVDLAKQQFFDSRQNSDSRLWICESLFKLLESPGQ